MSKLFLATALLLSGCGSMVPPLECEIERDRGGKAVVSSESFSLATAELVAQIDVLSEEIEKHESLVGFRGSLRRYVADTQAYDFALRMNDLRSEVARQKAREFGLLNDGDTLLGTSRDWQCQNFADSVASLDLAQTQRQLLSNMRFIKNHFRQITEIWRKD